MKVASSLRSMKAAFVLFNMNVLISFQGVPPTKTIEAAEIAVRTDPLTIILDGQGRVPGIGDQLSLNRIIAAEGFEYLPVPPAWPQDARLRGFAQIATERQGRFDRCGISEDPGIGDDPNKTAENGFRKGEGFWTRCHFGYEFGISLMLGTGIRAVGVNENINVAEPHFP